MTGDLRAVYDCTGANLPGVTIPAGIGVALYTTGSGGVPASAAQLAAHPAAVRIDQAPVNTALDELTDVLDYERSAATLADLAPWYAAAARNYATGARPGQRWPAIYAAASNVTPVANQLTADGIKSGPRLWVASWDLPVAQAIGMLTGSGGPYPVIGVQVHNAGSYDISLFRVDWLDTTSHAPSPPPANGIQPGWGHCSKCSGLAYPAAGGDTCPAGGKHDTAGSYDYPLPWRVP